MKLALKDDIWNRLYGPYGNRRVDLTLAKLQERWGQDVANDLFWEDLHHQDDIYPATFAALPWLLEISPEVGPGFMETHLFVSHVISCACDNRGAGFDGTRPKGNYRGLSTRIADHRHSWLPENEWLTDADQPVLAGLEAWFSDRCGGLAEICLALVETDMSISAHALEGFAVLHGSDRVSFAVQMLAEGEDVAFIHEELGDFDERDSQVVGLLYPHIHQRNMPMTSFLIEYPGCRHVLGDPR